MKIYQRNFNLSANDSLAYIAHAIESNVRVLDVGCGAGDLGAYLRNEKQLLAQA
ncbi:methionine biosynthesis protein MetW [Ostreibacterium oceani]|uniref:Methionine biosynthesis protein MetW n=1 Tax=Ostreibacterium oceani TaxID=2654998 RepID=A0A6N7ER33_9GAMM|nr:methionine biosynthesis protein MetW [Ostreibacterium oceani]MPV85324.1 hypothetical protein [Ostreibacterium oceani]